MSSSENLLKEAESNAKSNPAQAEKIYKQILSSTAGKWRDLLWYNLD